MLIFSFLGGLLLLEATPADPPDAASAEDEADAVPGDSVNPAVTGADGNDDDEAAAAAVDPVDPVEPLDPVDPVGSADAASGVDAPGFFRSLLSRAGNSSAFFNTFKETSMKMRIASKVFSRFLKSWRSTCSFFKLTHLHKPWMAN